MRRVIFIGVLGVCLALWGCSLIPNENEPSNPFDADFSVTIVSDGPKPTVVVRAGDWANIYHWEFYGADATQPPFVIEGGQEKRTVTYTWPEVGPGAYVIVLVAVREGAGGGGGGGGSGAGGCCGPAPGPGGTTLPGNPGEDLIATSYKVVRFAGSNNLIPVLVFSTWSGGIVTDYFYPGQKVCVNALESIGEQLTYRIEIVRVVSVNDPTPIPYPWNTEVEYIITDNPLYCFYIPGPGGCSGETWTFRVTLRIRDKWWKEATVTEFIYSGCCP